MPWDRLAQAEETPEEIRERILALARREADTLLTDARTEAARLVHEAEQTASHVLDHAEGEIEALTAGARARGEAAGHAAGQAAFDEAVAAAHQLTDGLHAQRLALLRQAEPSLLALAVQIAEKIVRAQLSLDPAAVERVVRDALDRLTGQLTTVVYVGTQDYAWIHARWEELTLHRPDLRLAEDAALAPGGCRVENADGVIDCAIETQIALVSEALGVPET